MRIGAVPGMYSQREDRGCTRNVTGMYSQREGLYKECTINKINPINCVESEKTATVGEQKGFITPFSDVNCTNGAQLQYEYIIIGTCFQCAIIHNV